MTNSSASGFPESGTASATPSSFGLLEEPVQHWIWDKGWTELRGVQERAIPSLATTDADVVIAAATAGGKTEAAFLPLISRLLAQPISAPGFKLVYVSPLKALINDQFRRLDDLCEKMAIPVHRWHGDVSMAQKAKARKAPDGILLITPESLEALFVRRGLELPGLFQPLQAIVIDELHAFLGPERGVQLSSLMVRLEALMGRRVRRVGLSATLGDMSLACAYLRRENPAAVVTIVDPGGHSEQKGQLKAYASKPMRVGNGGKTAPPAEPPQGTGQDTVGSNDATGGTAQRIGQHLFKYLRGTSNLVFAGSRQNVEVFADLLLGLSEAQRVPNEFLPHHANLSRQHRELLEQRLKEGREPTTAVCTSTLELGIDIGEVESVAQIGPPRSVASLRQRLGRSGRRAGKPAILRCYVTQEELDTQSATGERLRLNLVQAIAVIELLIAGWCEPPPARALHLSTLVHQILSVIAQHGGAYAREIYGLLCRQGPFADVDAALFGDVLRCMGGGEPRLIEQSPEGLLLLGEAGERIVEHYSFYAVFKTSEEFRIETAGKVLGTLPVESLLTVGATIIFAGRRWQVEAIHDREKVIEVKPDPRGIAPRFMGGDAEPLHDRVAGKMQEVLAGTEVPGYLDRTARTLLEEGRGWFQHHRLDRCRIFSQDAGSATVFLWQGTAAVETLMLAMRASGLEANINPYAPVAIDCANSTADVMARLRELAGKPAPDGVWLARHAAPLQTEKYHPYLSDDLLARDAASSRIVAGRVPDLANLALQV
ncbi:MAG: DEAD/DEAH box helicase [Rhodospirillaceae bacterium]|nr:DEAD/DEAH box helicase [Rhodospirillaceae bacterium]